MTVDCGCDYDPPSFFSCSSPRARKANQCEECGGLIRVGEQYERVSGMWDGHISVFCTCERCYEIRVWLTNNLPCFCWAHGGMFEYAQESIREAYLRAPDEARGLMFGYHRRVIMRDRHNARARAS